MKSFPVLQMDKFPVEPQEMFYANEFQRHIRDHHRYISRPHKHDFFLTVLFTKGTGTHEVDFESFDIKPGSAFMLNPGQTHYWEFTPDTEGYILFHTRNFYDLKFADKSLDIFPFFYSLQNSSCLLIEGEEFLSAQFLFRLILREIRGEEIMKYQKIGSLLDLLYIELTRAYLNRAPHTSSQNMQNQDKLRKLELLIDKHFRENKSAGFYAEKMNMSTKHLNRITQAGLAKTTTDVITERVLLEAQRMLSYSSMSVSAVAENLGYADVSYFSRLFKRHLKISPSDFPKKYR